MQLQGPDTGDSGRRDYCCILRAWHAYPEHAESPINACSIHELICIYLLNIPLRMTSLLDIAVGETEAQTRERAFPRSPRVGLYSSSAPDLMQSHVDLRGIS